MIGVNFEEYSGTATREKHSNYWLRFKGSVVKVKILYKDLVGFKCVNSISNNPANFLSFLAKIYLFEVNNRNTRKRYEIYLKGIYYCEVNFCGWRASKRQTLWNLFSWIWFLKNILLNLFLRMWYNQIHKLHHFYFNIKYLSGFE